jgi:carboxylate-amine ligase
MVATASPSPAAGAYVPAPDAYDEAFTAPDTPRPHYAGVLDALAGADLDALSASVAQELDRRGVRFGGSEGSTPFHVDPVPRVLGAAEWRSLAAGLVQRARALNAFVADVYGARDIVAAGVVPAHVIDTAAHLEPLAAELPPSPVPPVLVAGLDVVRDPGGKFLVLEDNVRTPSGLAFAAAARAAVAAELPHDGLDGPTSPDAAVDSLAAALAAAAPDGEAPAVALLSDGPADAAFFEHGALAAALGVLLVTPSALAARDGRLWARVEGEPRPRPVNVLYRRTDESRLTRPDGAPTALAEVLLGPLRAGRVTCVNAFGAGVADDKLVHAYVEEMVRFYLGEEPLLRSVRTHDLTDPGVRARALRRIGELVVKPRGGFGGHGVVVCAHASDRDRERAAALIRSAPAQWVVQETVRLSCHPTVVDGRLAPRHVDLRPFVISPPAGEPAVACGLTRVAMTEGALVVNSSQQGGAKDTWVLA